MTLPNDVAALLREALSEADALHATDGALTALLVLRATIGYLLPPLPIEPDQGQPEGLFANYLLSGDEADLPF